MAPIVPLRMIHMHYFLAVFSNISLPFGLDLEVECFPYLCSPSCREGFFSETHIQPRESLCIKSGAMDRCTPFRSVACSPPKLPGLFLVSYDHGNLRLFPVGRFPEHSPCKADALSVFLPQG